MSLIRKRKDVSEHVRSRGNNLTIHFVVQMCWMVLMEAVKIQRITIKTTVLGKSKMMGSLPLTNLDFQGNIHTEFG
jgi:hypothetical protein